VHAVAELFILDPGDHLRRHLDAELGGQTLDALFLADGGLGREPVDHLLRHRDAGDVLIHVFGHAGGLEGDDAGHDVRLDAGLLDDLEETLEQVEIKDALGLDVHSAAVDLLAQLVDLQKQRLVERRHGRALVELRRRARELIAAAVAVGLLHLREHPQDADGVEIVDGLGLGAVADDGMVAREGQHGVDAEGRGGEHVRHDAHAVAVAAGDLQNGLKTRLLEVDAEAERGRLEAGGLHVGHVDGVDLAAQHLGGGHLLGEVEALGRGHFGGHAEFAGFEYVLKHAHHLFPLKLTVLG